MKPPAEPLVAELLSYFEQGPSHPVQHFLDLPRAAVVQGIPEHRPSRDFVALPARPVSQDDLMRQFLVDSGVAVPAQASEAELQRLVADVPESFRTYRSEAVRDNVRRWLDEHGVIYTG